MRSVEEQLAELKRLPEADRTRLALALLDSVGGVDPHEGMTPAEIRAELLAEAEVAGTGPADSLSWDEARSLIERSPDT